MIHFVSGGFSGATQVAINLTVAAASSTSFEPLLVLRRKRRAEAKVAALRQQGVSVHLVAGLFRWLTVLQLYLLCRTFRPDIMVAHGFREHILGRFAAWLARTPTLVHVEHNTRERYSWWSLRQSRWLARHTQYIIGVSDGVRSRLLELGMPADKVISIPNGIDVRRFARTPTRLVDRSATIVMCARFSGQKDHATAVNALALLKHQGVSTRMIFAGGGKMSHRRQIEKLVEQLALKDNVDFIGVHGDIPALLDRHRICLLSTHYEGMPLALIEGMAAGCAVVGSDVIGLREVIDHGHNGLLVPEGDPHALAHSLALLLSDPERAQRMADEARASACAKHSLDLMLSRYEAVLTSTQPQRDQVPAQPLQP